MASATVKLGSIVIDPQRGEYGMATEITSRMRKGFKVRRLVCVKLQPALKEGGEVTRWYRAGRLRVVGPYAVVMPRTASPYGPLTTVLVPDSSPFAAAVEQHMRDLGDDRFDGAPGMYGKVQA